MNAATLLLAPWRAIPQWTRWYVRVIGVAAVLGAVGIGLFVHRPNGLVAASAVLAFGDFFMGMFFIGPTLLLAIDARQLRLPGMQRGVVLGALAWVLALVAVPAAAVGVAGGMGDAAAGMLAMGLGFGAIMALLPRYVASLMGLLPLAFTTLAPQMQLPSAGQPGFLPLCAAVAGGLLAICALCWRRQMRADDPYQQGWSRPMVLQFRRANRGGGWSGLSGGMPDSLQRIRQQPEWMRPQVALGSSGPRDPRYSLRVALGGPFMPVTLAGRLRQVTVSVLPSVLVIVLLLVQSARRHGGLQWANLLDPGHVALVGWFIAFVGVLVSVIAAAQLGQRWQKNNAELPLLALLPGLGGPAQVRRALLQASLLPGVRLQLGIMALLVALGVGLHMDWVATGSLLLVQVMGIALLAAYALMAFGGRPLPGWVSGTITIGSFVLTGVTLFASLVDERAATMAGGLLLPGLGAGWLVVLVVLAWLGRRGWRGLCARPHPFLANG